MSERRYSCIDCGEPQALEPDTLCPECETAEQELEDLILKEHEAEVEWAEMTAEERCNVQQRRERQ